MKLLEIVEIVTPSFCFHGTTTIFVQLASIDLKIFHV